MADMVLQLSAARPSPWLWKTRTTSCGADLASTPETSLVVLVKRAERCVHQPLLSRALDQTPQDRIRGALSKINSLHYLVMAYDLCY
jgi:hypothetical protein